MDRWENCPGSVKLSEGMPNISSSYAAEGTTAHERAAIALEAILKGKPLTPIATDVPEDMDEAVATYVAAFVEAAEGANIIEIEKRFDLSKSLYPGLFGTSDGILYHRSTKTLQVWDYKHGAGIPVEVVENQQLMYYALGALIETKVPCEWVEMVICQPRCDHADGPIRKWKIPAIDLIEFAGVLVDAAKRTQEPNPKIVPGDHCRFCPAVAKCPALQERALTAAQAEFSPTFSYDPEKLSETLALIPKVEAWLKGVEEFAFSEAQAGRCPPGFKLVAKQGRRKWKDEDEVEKTLLLECGLDYTQVRGKAPLKSPAQIEKIINKADKKLLEDLVVKESSGVTLVPDSDKRPSAKVEANTEFTVITDETATKE